MEIWVCPHSRLDEILDQSHARHLIALVSDERDFRCPDVVPQNQFLISVMNDICEPREGLTLPSQHHLKTLLDFYTSLPPHAPLLLTCYAGISRSTAIAYVLACAHDPHLDERQLAQKLRLLSPAATPNKRLVALGDQQLARNGRMQKAIAEIGRGADAFEGQPFVLGLSSAPQQRYSSL